MAPVAVAPATLGNLGTPQGSPKHADKHHHHHHGLLHRRHKEHKEQKEVASEKRRVIAFIGGLDLTDGRYDTPDHHLFDTLRPDGVHNKDFYNICIEGRPLLNLGCLTSP